ncbi:hypothetical protein TrVFT333_010042 [Trichoderma virens FT-333]|nr:hypothetical protein TrVFT333_010042 [Trichoderma virens FT-333]
MIQQKLHLSICVVSAVMKKSSSLKWAPVFAAFHSSDTRTIFEQHTYFLKLACVVTISSTCCLQCGSEPSTLCIHISTSFKQKTHCLFASTPFSYGTGCLKCSSIFVTGDSVDIGSIVEQHTHYHMLVVASSCLERSSIFVTDDSVDIGAIVEQQGHHVNVPLVAGCLQCVSVFTTLGIYVDTQFEQPTH